MKTIYYLPERKFENSSIWHHALYISSCLCITLYVYLLCGNSLEVVDDENFNK